MKRRNLLAALAAIPAALFAPKATAGVPLDPLAELKRRALAGDDDALIRLLRASRTEDHIATGFPHSGEEWPEKWTLLAQRCSRKPSERVWLKPIPIRGKSHIARPDQREFDLILATPFGTLKDTPLRRHDLYIEKSGVLFRVINAADFPGNPMTRLITVQTDSDVIRRSSGLRHQVIG